MVCSLFDFSDARFNADRTVDGDVMNTCAGCFEPKLDPKAAEIYCTGCKDSPLRSIGLEKNPSVHEFAHSGIEASFPHRTGAHPHKLVQSEGQSQMTELGLRWKSPTSSKWAFQPCIDCQTNSLLCDAAVPSCTQCMNTNINCKYRHLINTGKPRPIRCRSFSVFGLPRAPVLGAIH